MELDFEKARELPLSWTEQENRDFVADFLDWLREGYPTMGFAQPVERDAVAESFIRDRRVRPKARVVEREV